MSVILFVSFQPFPVEPHKGWKLNSFLHGHRVWTQEISPNNSDLGLDVFAAYAKVRVPPQVVLQKTCEGGVFGDNSRIIFSTFP